MTMQANKAASDLKGDERLSIAVKEDWYYLPQVIGGHVRWDEVMLQKNVQIGKEMVKKERNLQGRESKGNRMATAPAKAAMSEWAEWRLKPKQVEQRGRKIEEPSLHFIQPSLQRADYVFFHEVHVDAHGDLIRLYSEAWEVGILNWVLLLSPLLLSAPIDSFLRSVKPPCFPTSF